jgi:hypothetical protein
MASGSFFLRLTKEFGKLLIAFALLGVGLYCFVRYKTHSMESFCRDVPTNATPASVLARARAMGFPAFDAIRGQGVVSVQNQNSPFFRFQCAVSFKDGHFLSKHVGAAD